MTLPPRLFVSIALLLLASCSATTGEPATRAAGTDADRQPARAPSSEGVPRVPAPAPAGTVTPSTPEAPAAPAEKRAQWGRGPIELEDQWPLANTHASWTPMSTSVLPVGVSRVRASFAWTNTLNFQGTRYTVDAENKVVHLQGAHGLCESLQVGIDVPIVWRDGGVLDGFLQDYHDFFGLKDTGRDDVPNDRYLISGTNTDGSTFSFKEDGTSLGDITLDGRYNLLAGDDSTPALTLAAQLRLPTARGTFGQDSVDVGLALLASKRFSDLVVYGGVGWTHYFSASQGGLDVFSDRLFLFASGELEVTPGFSPYLALWFASDFVKDVNGLEKSVLYLDVGGKIALTDALELEILFRENLIHENASADVTALVGLSFEF